MGRADIVGSTLLRDPRLVDILQGVQSLGLLVLHDAYLRGETEASEYSRDLVRAQSTTRRKRAGQRRD